jgi:site-specific DNA-methyltransferase (adenine-specific)
MPRYNFAPPRPDYPAASVAHLSSAAPTTGDWAKSRLKNLSATDQMRDPSKVGSGFGKRIANWLDRDMAYPTNVLHLATECGNRDHSAAFPEALPEWFIKLFTQEGDWVLDPFLGSGTVSVVSKRFNRNSVGIEVLPDYYQRALERVGEPGLQIASDNILLHERIKSR